MAQQVCDLFESGTALHQPTGQRMPQDVRAPDTVFKTAAYCGIANGIPHDIRVSWSVYGWTVAYEQLAPSRWWPTLLQVLDDCAAAGVGQWQHINVLTLTADGRCPRSPIDIVQLQSCHFHST